MSDKFRSSEKSQMRGRADLVWNNRGTGTVVIDGVAYDEEPQIALDTGCSMRAVYGESDAVTEARSRRLADAPARQRRAAQRRNALKNVRASVERDIAAHNAARHAGRRVITVSL